MGSAPSGTSIAARRPAAPAAAAAASRGESWRDEETRASVLPGADDLEVEAGEEADDLDLEDLSDDEEPELPTEAPVPEEDDSEW
jgi:hypothetical protein